MRPTSSDRYLISALPPSSQSGPSHLTHRAPALQRLLPLTTVSFRCAKWIHDKGSCEAWKSS